MKTLFRHYPASWYSTLKFHAVQMLSWCYLSCAPQLIFRHLKHFIQRFCFDFCLGTWCGTTSQYLYILIPLKSSWCSDFKIIVLQEHTTARTNKAKLHTITSWNYCNRTPELKQTMSGLHSLHVLTYDFLSLLFLLLIAPPCYPLHLPND